MELLAPAGEAKSAAYTGTAGNTGNFTARTNGVLVWATTDAYVLVGAVDAVATTTNGTPIPAYTPVLLKVPKPLEDFRVSAIQVSAGGTVYARPCAGT